MVANDTMQEENFKGWDKGLDYEVEHPNLEKLIIEEKNALRQGWYSVFFTQLENGSRIGEALHCLFEYAENEKQEQHIRTEKRKDGHKRLMIIPKTVFGLPALRSVFRRINKKFKKPVTVAIQRCRVMMSYNTHALRHCRISYWLFVEKKTPVAVAATTGQTKLDTLISYAQTKEAEKMLRGTVGQEEITVWSHCIFCQKAIARLIIVESGSNILM